MDGRCTGKADCDHCRESGASQGAPGAAVDRGSDDARPEDVWPRPAPDVIGERLARIERQLDEQAEWWRALGDDVRKIMAAVEAPKKPRALDELNSAALDSHERRLARIEARLEEFRGAVDACRRLHDVPTIQNVDPVENQPHHADRGGARQDWQREKLALRDAPVTFDDAARIMGADTRADGEKHASKASDVTHEHQTENICGEASKVWGTNGNGDVIRLDVSRESPRRARKWWRLWT